MSRSGFPLLAVLALAPAARPARAQEPQPPGAEGAQEGSAEKPVELEPLEVRLPAPSLGSGAARAPGAAVTTVDASRFAGESKGAAELVATAPGVAVSEHGGPGQPADVSIRGSSAQQVKVLVDGLPLNGPAGGAVDLSTIPSQWISRIEVVRGTEGIFHGSGALGGVVNVLTTPAAAGTWGASATAGSFGSFAGDLHLGLGDGGWGLLGAISGSTTEGDFPYENPYLHESEVRENAAAVLGGGLLKGFWLGGGGRLDAAAEVSGGHRGLPGTLENPTPHDWQDEGRGLLAARFRRALGGGPVASAGGWLRLDQLDVSLQELDGGVPQRQHGAAGMGNAGLSWSGERGDLSAVAEAGGERLVADGMGEWARATVAAAFSGELIGLGGRGRLGPGVRLERSGPFSGISAKLGGSLGLGGPLALRASAGRTYRIPSFAELYLQQGVVAPNPTLRPEVGVGADAALTAAGPLGSASAGAFATLYDDLVIYEAVSFRRFVPLNDARSFARGLEAEAALAKVSRLLDLNGGLAYTYLKTETLRGVETVVGKELPQKPRHRLYARLGAGQGPVEVHGECQWLSSQWVDLANTASIPGSFTLGAGGSVRLFRDPDVHLNLEVRNLLDDQTLQDGFMNPLPGRTVLLTLRAGSPER